MFQAKVNEILTADQIAIVKKQLEENAARKAAIRKQQEAEKKDAQRDAEAKDGNE